MFKKFLICIMALSMTMLCGCTSASDNNIKDNKLSIVTTIFPAYDFARQIFGDSAEITLLLKPGMESHSYDPGAKDIIKITNCDLFIYNGGESDVWVENIIESAKKSESFKALKMMDAVNALEEEPLEGFQSEEHHHEEDSEEEYDEHIWTSPKNAVKIVNHIKDSAIELQPSTSDEYEANASEYVNRLYDLDKRFSELLKGEERYFVFGDRFPMLYFFKEYNLNYYAAFPGCGSETEPSAQSIAFLTEKLKGKDTIDAVFYIELSNHKLADTLANDTNLPSFEFHGCHNITSDDFEAGETYISLMERNYSMLEEVLS